MRYKLTTVDKIVGLVAVAAVLGCIGFAALVGKQRGWFAKPLALKTRFTSVSGLSRGAPVKMCDYPIGRVTRVVFNEDNEFDVEFEVFAEYRDRITETRYVQLETDVLQNPFINISNFEFDDKGNLTNVKPKYLTQWAIAQVEGLRKRYALSKRPVHSVLASGDFISPVNRPDLVAMAQEVISDFQKRLEPAAESMTKSAKNFEMILSDLSAIMSTLAKGEGAVGKFLKDEEMGEDIKQTIASVKLIATNMSQVTAELPKVVKEAHGAVANLNVLLAQLTVVGEKVPKLLDDVQGTLKSLDGLTANLTKVAADAPRLMKEIESVMANLNIITKDLANWTADTPELVQSIQAALNNANDIMQGLKRSVLLRGLVEQEQKRSLIIEQGRHSRYEKLTQP